MPVPEVRLPVQWQVLLALLPVMEPPVKVPVFLWVCADGAAAGLGAGLAGSGVDWNVVMYSRG